MRRLGTLLLTLCVLLAFSAGTGASAPTVRLVCRMSGVEMDPAPSHCNAVKAPGITAVLVLESPGCCDVKVSPGHAKSTAAAPDPAPTLDGVLLPAPLPTFWRPTTDAARSFPVADLTGPRPPPGRDHPARAPPTVPC
jgi:hypothetical protein